MTLARRNTRPEWLVLGGLIVLGACTSTPPPKAEMTAAELALREAEEANARDHAPTVLQQAREKLARARQAVEDGSMVDARRLAEQATVDAQLAEARARSGTAEANLGEVQQGLDQLRREKLEGPTTATTGG